MYASRRVTRRMAGKKRERSVRTAMMGFNDGLRGAVVAERIAKYLDLFCVYGRVCARLECVHTKNERRLLIWIARMAALVPSGILCNFLLYWQYVSVRGRHKSRRKRLVGRALAGFDGTRVG